MADDEKVNGPRLAAQILNRMAPSARARVLEAMKQADPKLAKKISLNIIVFDDIADLTAQGIQFLIREVEHTDLVLSLKLAGDPVKSALYSNMSERKRKSIEDDFAALPPTPISQVEEAQNRIVQKLDQLRTAGLVRSQAKEDQWV